MTINRKISLVLGIIVIVVAGGTATTQYVKSLRYPYSVPSVPAANSISTTNATTAPSITKENSTAKTQTTATPATKAPGTYAMADVATHNSGTSCWSAINGDVYDLTSWINQHPGGPQAILIICGKDGSAAFNDQHGGQRRPANELTGFKIGTLAAQ